MCGVAQLQTSFGASSQAVIARLLVVHSVVAMPMKLQDDGDRLHHNCMCGDAHPEDKHRPPSLWISPSLPLLRRPTAGATYAPLVLLAARSRCILSARSRTLAGTDESFSRTLEAAPPAS